MSGHSDRPDRMRAHRTSLNLSVWELSVDMVLMAQGSKLLLLSFRFSRCKGNNISTLPLSCRSPIVVQSMN